MHFLPFCLRVSVIFSPRVHYTPNKSVRVYSGLQFLVEWCFTSTETVGLSGTGAHDGHLDFHTAPELYATQFSSVLLNVHRNRRFIRDRELHYTRRHGSVYIQVHARRHLPSANTWIPEDRQLRLHSCSSRWSFGHAIHK